MLRSDDASHSAHLVLVVRYAASNKILTSFSEVSSSISCLFRIDTHCTRQNSDLQAEKRGNFVILSCVEGSDVVSWSLNVGDS